MLKNANIFFVLASCFAFAAVSMQQASAPLMQNRSQAEYENLYYGLSKYSAEFSGRISFKFFVDNKPVIKTIVLVHNWLPQSLEARFEAKDLRFHSEEENRKKFQNIAKKCGVKEFADMKKVAVAAIGSSSTQVNFEDDEMEGDNNFQTMELPFGTDKMAGDDDNDTQKKKLIDHMLATIGAKKKYVVFVSSVSFAEPLGREAEDFEVYNLKTTTFRVDNPKTKNSGKMANLLSDRIKASRGLTGVVVKSKDKLAFKWTRSIVLGKDSPFSPKVPAYIADLGGKGGSVKFVENLYFDDTKNLLGKNLRHGQDEYLDQDAICLHHKEGYGRRYMHPTQEILRERFITAVRLDIIGNYRSNPAIRSTDEFFVHIYQTGKQRQEFLEAAEFLKRNNLLQTDTTFVPTDTDGSTEGKAWQR